MSLKRVNRRHFLVGASGFALATPLLPSLLPSDVLAATDAEPKFVAMTTEHGGIWPENMWPGDDSLTNRRNLIAGHEIASGALLATMDGMDAVLSPVLRAAAQRMSSSVISKMNVLRGLDIMFYIAHHSGGHLGNYARRDGNGNDGDGIIDARPTIDQVMAWSPNFYSDLSNVRLRSMHIGSGSRAISWGYSEPSRQRGSIEPMPTATNSRQLFNQIFVPDDTGEEPRPPVVDRVLESYNRLQSGRWGQARQLSSDDRQRLSDHMDRLNELQRRLNVSGVSCGDVQPPSREAGRPIGGYHEDSSNPVATAEWYNIYNDVIVAAFICGTSRIATIKSTETFHSEVVPTDWHQNVAHQANGDATAQRRVVENQQRFFEGVFVDLAAKLDAVDRGDGTTLLDETLMVWSQESGLTTHNSDSMPVITAGSAAGTMNTGLYCDYTSHHNMGLQKNYFRGLDAMRRPGLSFNQYLGTVLQAVGVPNSEFERPGESGYAHPFVGEGREMAYTQQILNMASDWLPFLQA